MISTKINVDYSQVTKGLNDLQKQGKLTAESINKTFKDGVKIEVDTSELKGISDIASKEFAQIEKDSQSMFSKLKGSFDMSQIMNFSAGGLLTSGITGAVDLIKEGFTQAIEKGSEFEKQLNALGAVTGQSGDALKAIGDSALDLSTTFGGSVNAQLGAFQGILSKFGPQLAETPQYLNEVTKNVNLLAKAGGIDATEAMNSLTDVMMQFGVNVSDGATAAKESARYMNVLAASAQVGSAEISDVAQSILQVGVTAKSAGLSLEETNSAIQVLAGGGKKGAEAGVALRNSLQYLQKQSGEGDKVLAKMGLTTLQLGKSLGKDGLDDTLKLVSEGLNKLGGQTEQNQAMFQLFGADATAMGILLQGATGQMDSFTQQMTGTQSGFLQAQVNMQGFSESMSRLQANVDKYLIKTFLFVKDTITAVFNGITIFLNNTFIPAWEMVFTAIGEAFAPLIEEISLLYNEFMNLFKGAGDGMNVLGTLRTIFETLGSVIGVLVQIALQPLLLTFRALVGVYRLVYSGVQSIIDWFSKLSKETGLVSTVINGLKDGFNFLIKSISDAVGWVGNLLEKFGLIKKDKPTKEIKDDTDKIAQNTKETTNNIVEATKETEKQKVAVKTLQQQYDELYQATLKIAGNSKFVLQYEANIEKLNELKAKIEANNLLKTKLDFDLSGALNNAIVIPDTTMAGLKSEINAYFEKEKVSLSLAPIKQKELFNILPETELAKLRDKLTLSIADGFSKINYSNIFKKKENSFDESLNEDRNNLLTSLQKNELSYEEYSERLNEIDRNRRETQKEGNSEFIQGLNETLSISLANTTEIMNTSLSEIMNKSGDFTTKISENWDLMATQIAVSTTQMVLEGQNGFKALAKSAFDMLQMLVPIWSAQILGGSLATPQSIMTAGGWGLAQWAGLTALIQGAVSVARGALGFKDGVINLQGKGTGTSDSIDARLSAGESVITAKGTAKGENSKYLSFMNNGGDMEKLMTNNLTYINNNTELLKAVEMNNQILMSKEFNPSINNINKFNVSSSNIKVVRGR